MVAFDTVDHDIFLQCLRKTFGFIGLLLEWIRSYLTNRMQNVYLNGKTNAACPVLIGVPQGSVLGSLLCTLYMADVDEVIQSHRLKHHSYVDDNKVYASYCP